MHMFRPKRAFTLIELLIVVAIIAILVAIAVPSFLEAQTRAKVTRARSDIRTTVTALEMYAVDNNGYPPPIGFEPPKPFTVVDPAEDAFEGFAPYRLTTPVAYVNALPFDVFGVQSEVEHPRRVQWHYSEQRNNEGPIIQWPLFLHELAALTDFGGGGYRYLLFSHGPDLRHQAGIKPAGDPNEGDADPDGEGGSPCQYDPSNGTTSSGDIYYLGPGRGFK